MSSESRPSATEEADVASPRGDLVSTALSRPSRFNSSLGSITNGLSLQHGYFRRDVSRGLFSGRDNNVSRQQHFPARTVGQPIPRGNCHLRATATSVTLLPQCNRRGLLFDQFLAAKTDAEQQVVLYEVITCRQNAAFQQAHIVLVELT